MTRPAGWHATRSVTVVNVASPRPRLCRFRATDAEIRQAQALRSCLVPNWFTALGATLLVTPGTLNTYRAMGSEVAQTFGRAENLRQDDGAR